MTHYKGRKHLGFWTNKTIEDQKFLEWIDEKRGDLSYSQFIRDILNDVMDEKLIIPTTEDLKKQKIKVDIQFKKVMIKIKQKELDYWLVFKKSPSYQGKVAIKVGVDNQILNQSVSCFDEKNHRLVCPECATVIEFARDQSDLKEAKLLFVDHYFKLHGELTPKLERELLDLE